MNYKIDIPKDAILVAPKQDIYYADCFTLSVPKNWSCLALYDAMTSNLPRWIKLLFKVRDIIVKPFGVKAVKGFSGRITKENIKVGDQVDFFTLQTYKDELMVLSIKDVHLDVMVVLKLMPCDELQNQFFVTSSVKVHNWVGNYYMKLIIPWHQYIVRLMLRKFQKTFK